MEGTEDSRREVGIGRGLSGDGKDEKKVYRGGRVRGG